MSAPTNCPAQIPACDPFFGNVGREQNGHQHKRGAYNSCNWLKVFIMHDIQEKIDQRSILHAGCQIICRYGNGEHLKRMVFPQQRQKIFELIGSTPDSINCRSFSLVALTTREIDISASSI